MQSVTLCFLVKGDNICLAMKKRGFGEGKWNGVGGKVQKEESIEEAAIREMEEEIGVVAKTNHLTNVGNLQFYFKENPEWNQDMHIYFVHQWEGDPIESEEMCPKWHKKGDIPFKEMWVDDYLWLPKVLEGKRIEGEFHLKEGGGEIDKFELREI